MLHNLHKRFSKFLTSAFTLTGVFTSISFIPSVAVALSLTDTLNDIIPRTGLDLTLNSVTPITTVDNTNITQIREQVLNDWYYPNAEISEDQVTVDGVFRVGDQLGLTSSHLQEHINFLNNNLVLNDVLYRVNWTLVDSNQTTFDFASFGWEDSQGDAKFETLTFMSPLQNSNYIRVLMPTSNSASFEVTSLSGAGASGESRLNFIGFDQNHQPVCTTTNNKSASFLWEGAISGELLAVTKMGNMSFCNAKIRFGFASGFKSIKVMGGGFGLEVSGALGWSGQTEKLLSLKIPPKPVPEPLTILGAGTAVAFGAGFKRKIKRSNSIKK